MSYANRGSLHILLKHDDDHRRPTGFMYDLSNELLYNKAVYCRPTSCFDIYFKENGLVPNYAGHVPGAKFKYGETFGHLTVNAKSYIQRPRF